MVSQIEFEVRRIGFGALNQQSAFRNLKLTGSTGWNLFGQFLLLCWCQFFFDLPVLLGKGILSFDEKPILPTRLLNSSREQIPNPITNHPTIPGTFVDGRCHRG